MKYFNEKAFQIGGWELVSISRLDPATFESSRLQDKIIIQWAHFDHRI